MLILTKLNKDTLYYNEGAPNRGHLKSPMILVGLEAVEDSLQLGIDDRDVLVLQVSETKNIINITSTDMLMLLLGYAY